MKHAAFVILLAVCAKNAMSNEPILTSGELTPEQREQVDTLALGLPTESVRKRTREKFNDLTGWLTKRAPMPVSYELDRVREMHEQTMATSTRAETPDWVSALLEQLNDQLPEHLTRGAGNFRLFVLKQDEPLCAAGGQNLLYVSTATINDTPGCVGERERIGFLLAGQMAAACLGHCRGWYQNEWAAAAIRREPTDVSRIETTGFAGSVLNRKATPTELFSEDLFALHLCRQAGFGVQKILDVLRQEVLAKGIESVSANAVASADASANEPQLPESIRSPLRRLRRLLIELDGTVPTANCGLHEFKEGKWEAVADKGLAGVDRALFLLHGMSSDLGAFDDMLAELKPVLPESIAIVGLRYPSTGSLYRSSKFLQQELKRCAATTDGYDFACHSAGGLVFRRATEFDELPFRTATLIGTPNAGSDLASLRPLVEAQEFFGSLRGSFSRGVAEVVEDGTTQMVRDLEPGSLFLSELNNSPSPIRNRYQIVRGQALSSRKSLLLALAIGAARAGLLKLAESKLHASRQESAATWISRLRVPEEVRRGDLAVTLTSATTQNAAELLTVSTAHTKLPEDKLVIELVRRTVAD